MAIVNGYATLAEIRGGAALNFDSTYTTDDALLEAIITGTSRAIDKQTSRYFYKSSTAETRYFTAKDYRSVYVGDLISISTSGLVTDTNAGDRSYPFTWATTDYDLFPFDAATASEPEPYRWIDITPQGTYQFPKGIAKGVKITGIFGWSAVPTLIAKACLIWSERIYKRLSTPLGSASMTPMGAVSLRIPPPDPDVEAMLANYRIISF